MEKRRFYHLFSDGFRTDACRRSEPIDFDIKLMEDEKYILNSIAYVLRNGIAGGIGAKYQYLGIAGAGWWPYLCIRNQGMNLKEL